MKTKPSSVEEIRKQTKNLIDAHKKSIQDFHENHFPHLFGREGRMIDWTPEAIEAAHRAMFQGPYDGTTAAMIGAGLDAAAAAQGIKDEENARLREENSRLREVIERVLVGGNHVALLIGADHPPDTATHDTAIKHYGSRHDEYEAWCCWKAIRAAAAAIREGGRDG